MNCVKCSIGSRPCFSQDTITGADIIHYQVLVIYLRAGGASWYSSAMQPMLVLTGAAGGDDLGTEGGLPSNSTQASPRDYRASQRLSRSSSSPASGPRRKASGPKATAERQSKGSEEGDGGGQGEG